MTINFFDTTPPTGINIANLIACYAFDGSVDHLVDRTGNGNGLTGTLITVGTSSFQDLTGQAIGAGTSYLSPTTMSESLRIDGALTIEMTYQTYASIYGTARCLFDCWSSGDSLTTNVLYRAYNHISGIFEEYGSGGTDINYTWPNTWFEYYQPGMFTYTRNIDGLRNFYWNGKLIRSITLPMPAKAGASNTQIMYLGGSAAAANLGMNGILGGARFFDACLTPEQVLESATRIVPDRVSNERAQYAKDTRNNSSLIYLDCRDNTSDPFHSKTNHYGYGSDGLSYYSGSVCDPASIDLNFTKETSPGSGIYEPNHATWNNNLIVPVEKFNGICNNTGWISNYPHIWTAGEISSSFDSTTWSVQFVNNTAFRRIFTNSLGRFFIAGDFDIQVDHNISYTSGHLTRWFEVCYDARNTFGLYYGLGSYDHVRSIRRTDSDSETGISQTFRSDIPGKFRITRVGELHTAYYWNGSVWVSHGTYTWLGTNQLPIFVDIKCLSEDYTGWGRATILISMILQLIQAQLLRIVGGFKKHMVLIAELLLLSPQKHLSLLQNLR